MKTTNSTCGDKNFPGFCGDGTIDCNDQVLQYTDGKLVVMQNGHSLFSQQFYLKEVVTEYSVSQLQVAPGEEKQAFLDADAEFIFIWVSWLSGEIVKPLFVKYSGYDENQLSTDFLNANWNPLYNQMSLTSIPGYPITDMLIKNPNLAPTSQDGEPDTAKVLIFTAKTN
jgi:hypothetical protein